MEIKIKNASLKFLKEKENFFENVNLAFPTKSIHYVRGENGSGKSTFLKILNGSIDQNTIIDGHLSTNKKNVAIVRQNYESMLALPFSANENLLFAKMENRPKFKIEKGINNGLITENINMPMDIPMYKLSGGQKQIVAIAMTLQKPIDVLLLDEPTSALDEQNAKLVFGFLEKIIKDNQITIFIVCHQKEHIKKYGNSFYIKIKKQKNKLTRIIEQYRLEN